MRRHLHERLALALVVALSVSPSFGAAKGKRANTSASKGGRSVASYQRVPEGGQSAMKWSGLDLAGQVDNFAIAGTVQAPVWRPVAAPGMKAAPPPNSRSTCDLLEGWTFIPISSDTGQPGKPRATAIPDRFPAERNYVAGWYTRRVPLTPRDGECLVMLFEQVPLFCVLFVNGVECGRHLGAYTPFEFDLTRVVRSGVNVVALYVHDASAALGRDALGRGKAFNQIGSFRPSRPTPLLGGVWGAVRLEQRPATYVRDVFVKTSTRRHELSMECELDTAATQPQSGQLDFTLLNWPDGSPVVLPIPSQQVSIQPGEIKKISITVPWANPRFWSPDFPNLYVLRTKLTTGNSMDVCDTRFGFREFWAEDQQFMLNGTPIRLRGESRFFLGKTEQATDPIQGRDNCREECFSLKERYRGNAARLSAQIMSGNVALGADEAGYLLIAQSSIWSVVAWWYRNGGEPFLDNTRREFAEWIRRDRNSPSVVIWDVENEQLRLGEDHKPWAMRLDGFVHENDDTRLIEHSGAGWYDKNLEIVHLHAEEQFTDIMERWRARGNHPLIMGEWWVGFQGGEFRLTSSLEYRSRAEYTIEEARLYEEELLQMRNFGVSGIMPFQVVRATPQYSKEASGSPWATARNAAKFGDKAEACARAVHHGLQPLTIFFWPRVISAAAGESLKRELVVCNDSETARDLTAEWSVSGDASQMPERSRWSKADIRLAPGEQRRLPVSFVVPGTDCHLVARLLTNGGKVEATEDLALRVADPKLLASPALRRQLIVYEAGQPGAVEKLNRLGIKAVAAAGVPANPQETLWVIAPGASDAALNGQSRKISEYLEEGGRILCLAQEQWLRWSPVQLGFWSGLRASPWYYVTFDVPKATKESYYSCYAPIYAAGHPAFDGIGASDLRLWSPRDGRISDDALVRPAAAGNSSAGAWRILAGGCRPELASLAEAHVGKGTVVFCQAQVLEQSQTAEARLVLMNLLRYLDGMGWASGSGHVRLAGALTAAKASALTGVRAETFASASPERGDTLIATDGAVLPELEQWAEAGGTVLILSAEVAQRLPGYVVANDKGLYYVGVYSQGHPLLWGVPMESFMGVDHPCVEGVLTKTPSSARVLLHGLSAKTATVRGRLSNKGKQQVDMFDAAGGAVAVAQPRGKGQWIVTTMTPWHGQTLFDGELMRTLLANAGVAIPIAGKEANSVKVLKTVPLKIDGRLNDWTSDVEDRNVSQYVHAQPIVLFSQDATGAKLRNDADLSAIVYLLWNENALCLAGVVFNFNQGGATTLSVRIDGHILSLVPSGNGVSVLLDGKSAAALRTAFGRTTSDDLTDARPLSLYAGIAPRTDGELEKVPGATFEIEAPWSALGWDKPPTCFSALIRVERIDGAAISSPAASVLSDPNTWLTLTLAP